LAFEQAKDQLAAGSEVKAACFFAGLARVFPKMTSNIPMRIEVLDDFIRPSNRDS
jgi:hypothetical protein